MIEALLQAERLLVHGMLEQAEAVYRRTLESDPRNSIAIVGLARVALERADDRLAYQHACAALEVDPQNVAALRLEARLSEVLAARGEPVERPAWLASADRASVAVEKQEAAPATSKGSSAGPAQQPRQSEQVVLTRNPSMEDHRRRAERERSASEEAGERQGAQSPGPPAPNAEGRRRRRPKGFIRRLFGID